MNGHELIAIDAGICHGQPCFKGTRIMVYLVLEFLEAGVSFQDITSRYFPQLTEEAVRAALHYAAEVIKQQEYVPLTEVS